MERYFTYEMTQMPCKRLKSSQAYQRPISPKHVKDITENFEWNCVAPIRVSDRGGVYHVFDGQNTLSAIKTLFGDEVIVPVILYKNLSYEEEARLTAILDKYKRKMTCLEVDNALLESRDNDHVEFVSLCASCGWEADFSVNVVHKNYYVQNCSFVFKSVYMKHGAEFTRRYLDVFTQAFDGDCDAMRSPIERGLLKFMEVYEGEYSDKTLIRSLRGKEPGIIIGNMKDDVKHNGDNKYGYTILVYYNKASHAKNLPSKFEK